MSQVLSLVSKACEEMAGRPSPSGGAGDLQRALAAFIRQLPADEIPFDHSASFYIDVCEVNKFADPGVVFRSWFAEGEVPVFLPCHILTCWRKLMTLDVPQMFFGREEGSELQRALNGLFKQTGDLIVASLLPLFQDALLSGAFSASAAGVITLTFPEKMPKIGKRDFAPWHALIFEQWLTTQGLLKHSATPRMTARTIYFGLPQGDMPSNFRAFQPLPTDVKDQEVASCWQSCAAVRHVNKVFWRWFFPGVRR